LADFDLRFSLGTLKARDLPGPQPISNHEEGKKHEHLDDESAVRNRRHRFHEYDHRSCKINRVANADSGTTDRRCNLAAAGGIQGWGRRPKRVGRSEVHGVAERHQFDGLHAFPAWRGNVRCLEKSYDAVFERQIQLRRELGKDGKPADASTANAAVRKEIDAGRLKNPTRSAVGFQMRGPAKAFNWNTNTASAEIEKWEMIMVPNATGASLSLPNKKPEHGGLWVMDEGTPGAHIMVEHSTAEHSH
jgi:hypothetical protein